jgi:hypothetical protein
MYADAVRPVLVRCMVNSRILSYLCVKSKGVFEFKLYVEAVLVRYALPFTALLSDTSASTCALAVSCVDSTGDI